MIRRELNYILTSLMFFTRIPILVKLEYSPEILGQSRRYFPLVGVIVALSTSLVLILANSIFSTEVSTILSMIFSVLLTGAFHEDGFLDVCDGFGGGYGKDKILTIMKDSRIGAYAGIGAVLLLLFKFILLKEVAAHGISFLLGVTIFSHSISRFMASLITQYFKYVQDIDKSKAKPIGDAKLNTSIFILSFLPCLFGLYFVSFEYLISATLFSLLISLVLSLYFHFDKEILNES